MPEELEYPAPPDSEAIARASRDEIVGLQNAGLQHLMARAWTRIPFYRDKWKQAGVKPEDVRTIADLRHIPIVTKREFEENLSAHPPFGTYQGDFECARVQASSGSFGNPKPYFHTARDWNNIGNFWARRLAGQGVRQGDRVQICFTYALFIPGFTSTEGAMKLRAMVIPTGSGAVTPSERQLQVARDWGTTVLGSTGSYALHLAEVAASLGYDPAKDFRIRTMFHTSELLTEEMREKIQKLWNCKSYNNFGSVETGAPAWECEFQDGMHINEDAYCFEIVDPDNGQPVPDGAEGALVVTSLFKEAAPVIRYQIGDIASLIPGHCKCGRTFKRLGQIRGRIDDMLKIRGVTVYPSAIDSVLRKFAELSSEYRIMVETERDQDKLTVQVEQLAGTIETGGLDERIGQALKTNVGVQCHVELLPPGALSQSAEVEKRIKMRRVWDVRRKELS